MLTSADFPTVASPAIFEMGGGIKTTGVTAFLEMQARDAPDKTHHTQPLYSSGGLCTP